ncbi:MAG: helix-turn-helix domain-containing protein [Bacteroidales bacterium]|nr:helix-turn-helix domain-containing protein [Bacteroidales bacterium]
MNEFVFILPALVSTFWAVRIFLERDSLPVRLLFASGLLAAALAFVFADTFYLFVFPFIFLAVREYTSGKGLCRWDYLIFLPSMLMIPYTGSIQYNVLLALHIIGVPLWSMIAIRKFNREMSEMYDTANDDSDFLSQTVIFATAALFVFFVLMKLAEFVNIQGSAFYIMAAFLSVFQYVAGYYAFRIPKAPVSESSTAGSVVTAADAQDSAIENGRDETDQLLQKVLDDKMYLDPSITLVSMASKLHTNRTYLSASIHRCYGQNFSDFINSRRIAYAAELMAGNSKDLNIKDIAMQSGYSNLQSFYRNFSEIMEMTPKTWMEKCK